jgi:CBS-domain-containing membrane protein
MSTSTGAAAGLGARTGADLMIPNPVSLGDADTAREAIAFLTGREFGAAPVIDEAGRAVGVLSASDLLIHVLARGGAAGDAPVRELMTPTVLCVRPEAAAQLARLKAHQLYVVDGAGALVGVLSTPGLLRQLGP